MALKYGFTLIELVVVMLIIVILSTLGVNHFNATRERTLDKEATSTLLLIMAAEKIYQMENGAYYPADGLTVTCPITINDELKLSLPTSSANWEYSVECSGTVVLIKAKRAGGTRTWTLNTTHPDEIY